MELTISKNGCEVVAECENQDECSIVAGIMLAEPGELHFIVPDDGEDYHWQLRIQLGKSIFKAGREAEIELLGELWGKE